MELPWLEKYRPHTLSTVAGHEDTVRTLRRYAAQCGDAPCSVPNILLCGPPGVGKTSLALAFVRACNVAPEDQRMFVEVDASLERSHTAIASRLRSFLGKCVHDKRPRFVLLDESDEMTDAAMEYVCSVLEQHEHKPVVFLLTCNEESLVHPGIKSHCVVEPLYPLPDACIEARILDVAATERMVFQHGALAQLCRASDGDVRKAINDLQACFSATEDRTVWGERRVDCALVCNVCSTIDERDANRLVVLCLHGRLAGACAIADEWLYDGFRACDVVERLVAQCSRVHAPFRARYKGNVYKAVDVQHAYASAAARRLDRLLSDAFRGQSRLQVYGLLAHWCRIAVGDTSALTP